MDVTVSSKLGKHDVLCSTDLIRPIVDLVTNAKSSLSIISRILTSVSTYKHDTTDMVITHLAVRRSLGTFKIQDLVEEKAGLQTTGWSGLWVRICILDRSAKPETFAGKPDRWPMISMVGNAVTEIVHLRKRQKSQVVRRFASEDLQRTYCDVQPPKLPWLIFFSLLEWSVCAWPSIAPIPIAVTARSSGVRIVIIVASRQRVTHHSEAQVCTGNSIKRASAKEASGIHLDPVGISVGLL
ncbi:hypothetical protein PspLS_07153 [Pyricularia sp. CBS 133598]|nr:hypothetical protein PspLS_07153 [Pyricularia sp. CBS 133598]